MAIYHQHIKVFSRAKGNNIVKSIAYRRGIKLIDPTSGKIYDYSRKKNVIHSEIVIPKDATKWIKDLVDLEKIDANKAAQLLANSIELREKRKDSQLAREIEIALPMELDKEQNLALCHDFISFFTEHGMVAEFNIHWENGNPHAHIILSMRELIEDGWGKKIVEWNNKNFINKSREILAEKINNHLFMAGIETKVSHLSNYDLGIDQEATVHVGNRNNSNQQARETNNKIHLENLNKIIENPEIIFDKLSLQQSTFDLKGIAKTLNTQLDPANQEISIIPKEVGVIDFEGTAAPNLWVVPSIDQKITPSNIQEVPLPKIEIQPNSSPQQVVEQILMEITKSESVFTERYLTYVLSKHVKNPSEVAKILLEIKGSTKLMSIGFGEDGRERYTTRDMFDIENELQDLAVELSSKAKHKVAGWLINRCLTEFNLKDDQAEAIRFILNGKDISCIIGRAGTGKSYSLKAACWAWEKSGFQVYGVALAGIAAQNLEQDSGITSRTIESFAYAISTGQLNLSNQNIIVMDEAGMTDSISMAKIIVAVKQAGAKLVLVGDQAQLQPVGPGAIFRALLERLGFAELTTIRRQKEAWQREATFHFAAGNTEKALGFYQEHGQIHLTKTSTTALELLVDDWHKAIQRSSLADHLILAYLNADVDQLNQLAREKIISQEGLLQSYQVQIEHKILQVAIGERVIFLENNWRYQVKNGQRGTISAIEIDDQNQVKLIQVRLDGEQNKIIVFEPADYKKFSYGYACTVYRSQGVTVKNSFILAAGRWCKNLTYVAMTRHQKSANIYASEETYKTIEELKKGLAKGRLKDSILDYPEAFAERRGVDPQSPNNIILLQQHIAKKLKAIKQKFADTYARIVSPKAYQDNIAYQNKITQTLQRREDARLVAAYIDAHCQVGKAWAEFKASNDHAEYRQILNQAQILRNSIAAKIYAELSKYTLALEIYDLKLENLEKQAKQHELCLRVLCYIDKSKVSIILRDKLASEIEADLKAHYPYLKSEKVNTKQLVEQAKEHHRRMFLLKLSVEQRKAFKQVEHYLNLSRRSAELWKKCREGVVNKNVNATLMLPTKKQQQSNQLALQRGIEINQERDRLAYIIKNNQTLYQVALDYFEFGSVVSEEQLGLNDSLMLPAEQQYQSAIGLSLIDLPKDEQSLYNAVALYLGQNISCLRSTVAVELEHNIEAQQLIALPIDKTIGEYITDLKTTNQWAGDLDLSTLSKVLNRPIITIGSNGKIINLEVINETYNKEPIFVHYDNTNNYNGMVLPTGSSGIQVLAKLQQEMQRNKRGHDRAKRLETHAKYHELCSRVQGYIDKSKGSIILRDKLANEIAADLKAHYPYLKNENVNTKQLIEHAKEHRRRMFLLKLSVEQRKAFKQVEHYLKLSRKSAELWSQKREGTISEWVLHNGLKFNQERDCLAYTIKQNLTLYQAALDYFEIGTVENTISEARLKRLESQALEFERKKHLQENLIKFKKNVGNFKLRRLIAKEIVATPKYYHMARAAQIDPNSLYKYAKYQEKIELLDSLNPIERAAYLAAINYKQKRREVGKLWSEIFTQKNQGLPVAQKVFEKAIYLNAKRDELAYLIDQNMEQHHKFLLREQVPTKDLKKHAKYYENQLNLQQTRVAKNKFSAKTPYSTVFNHADPLERIYLQPKGFSAEQLEKQKYAREIVDYSIPIIGTLAEKYLKEQRGITGDVSEQVFRFNPGVKEPETKKEWSTLVVIARNKRQEVQSVQCIYLDPATASQLKVEVPKRTYGPQEGAKILVQHAKYIPGAYYKYALTFGPETALSIAEADRDLGVYLTLGANFANVPITTSCIDLLLCVDQEGLDSTANRSLNHAIESLAERGLNIYCARPNDVKDFNVVMKTQGALEVKRLLDDKKLVKKAVKIEQLIENKDNLVSDYAKVMVDFVTKYKEYKNQREPKSVEEVRSNHDLFKQLGKIASFIKDNGIFAEICERHKLEDQVYKIEQTYVQSKEIELEVEKLRQELNTKNPIDDYIKIVEEKHKLEQFAENMPEKKVENDLSEQIRKFAYIIQNTPTLQYEAKDLPIYNKIETQAFAYQRSKAMTHEIDLDMGFGCGD